MVHGGALIVPPHGFSVFVSLLPVTNIGGTPNVQINITPKKSYMSHGKSHIKFKVS